MSERRAVEVVVPRHSATCPALHNISRLGRCRCPKYLYVRGERLRISAHTRSWETAREKAAEYVDSHDPEMIARDVAVEDERPTQILLSEAVAKFLAARQLVNSCQKTIDNLKPDCNQLLHFIGERNRKLPESSKIFYVSQVTAPLLNDWMATWKGRQKLDRHGEPTTECTLYTKAKKRKHINMFFRYCADQGWLKDNPAAKMLKISKRNNPSAIPKIPFSREQMTAILIAAKKENHSQRAHAFVSTMHRSGLSILDTTTLERSRLHDDNRLALYRTKTGEDVYLLLEPQLAGELRQLPAIDGSSRYFFWHGQRQPKHASNNWGKILRKIFDRAEIKLRDRYGNPLQPSSHFFRNTFAKEMLEAGLSIDQVAMLLADSPATVYEHYHKWVPDLQATLDRAVRASWDRDGDADKKCPTCGRELGESASHAAAAKQTPAHSSSRMAS